ncbi:MAG: FAD-binding oxidoreductase [Chloroflexi bacterium]|nr:MAG: FAD-binding oxidoreductase [Chloroflexota bacterium]
MLPKNQNQKNLSAGESGTTSIRDDISIPKLRNLFKGQVITPGDEGYDQARTIFYGGVDSRPAVIIRVADETDVSNVITLARDTGLELAVRSGGHSAAGHSVTDGGIVLDLKNMRALEIDASKQTAWAQTGLTAGEYSVAADEYGLATGFGDTGSVGIGGITVGGGIGFLTRKFGMTIDSLMAANVVTADGKLLRTDPENHPDLFWAIRGGGGNFGVATRFKYRLHEVSTAYGGILILPATPEVITSFLEEAQAAPEELTTIANIMSAPPMPFLPAEVHGKIILMAMMVYAGPVEAGERAVAPFRALANTLADMLRPMRYPEIFMPEEGDYHPTAVGRTLFMDNVDLDTARTIVDYLESSDAMMRVAQIRVLGGAMARVSPDASAFAHRYRKIMAGFYAFYNGPEDKQKREAWVRALTGQMEQGKPGAYVNFMGEDGARWIHDAYPDKTWERLRTIKARYDPENIFHLNQNIPPKTQE